MPDGVPTADEINVFDSLDEQWTVKNFLGKSREEAEALFRENSLHYLDDLMHMGPTAFCYYVPAAIAYLRSPESEGDLAAADSFCSIVEWRLNHDGAAISGAKPLIREGIRAILDRLDRYTDEAEVWGPFLDEVAASYRALLLRL